MPGRPLLFDLRCRNDTICRTCLSSVRRQTVRPWASAFSSQAPRRSKQQRPAPKRFSNSITRPPSEAELRQYAEGLQNLRDGKPDDEDFSVRFFEQDEKNRQELSGEDAFNDSFAKLDTAELKASLQDMKQGLGSQDERDAFEAVMGEMGGAWDQGQSADDLEKMLVKMKEYGRSIDAEILKVGEGMPKEVMDRLTRDLSELPSEEDGLESFRPPVATPQIPEKPWTPNQRRKITRLNGILARVFRETRRQSGLTKKSVQSVYKAYHAARLPLAHGWSNVPLDVWDLLWTIFSSEESVNANRLSHVSMLARDMSDAKVTLNPPQQLLTIEAVFVDGWESKAIDNWKRCMSTLGDESSETFQSFWELGVRMYCKAGNMEQAERAVNKLLERHMSPRILMPMIRTWSDKGTEEGREKAWAAYWQMRQLLGDDMKLSDYDQVVSYFLTTNETENALYAFVDMMSDGEINLKKQKYMPSVVANKFFLGKWLKRLIGAGDLQGALNVVEFMQTKGVEAAPIHLNGLIGAWHRSGGSEDIEKADELAWKMIESRISFVEARNSSKTKTAPKSNSGPMPRATLETFSVLAENYRIRSLPERMEALWDAFRDAEISPDAFMMNQLLESHIQAGQWKEAVALYYSLVVERGVKPDPYTFSALWKTLAVNRLHVVAPDAVEEEIDATRRMFQETIKFKGIFMPDGMDGQLARKILHTFRKVKDNAGFLVALTALKDIFKFLPPETLVLEMVLGTTKLSWDATSSRRRLMVAKRDLDRDLLAWAEGDAEKLEGNKRGQALYEYLQKKFWPDIGGDADKGKSLIAAAKRMDVYELLAPKKGGGKR